MPRSPLLKRLTTTYLLAYNLASALGWGFVLFHALTALARDGPNQPYTFYKKAGPTLMAVQHLALLEIVHAATGLVPSNPLVTAIQVISRVFMLDLFTYPASNETSGHFSLFLMATSWALVEVPRYLFYFSQTAFNHVPDLLFFLRYTLFMVLYLSLIHI